MAAVAVPDSGVQPKLTGAHGPERPKAAYGRIIALNPADSTLSSESPGLRGPGRAGGASWTPHPIQGGLGWGDIAPAPLPGLQCGRVGVTRVGFARPSILAPRWRHCRDVSPVPSCPLLSPQSGGWPSSGSARGIGTWHQWLSPCGDTFRMGLESGSWDGEGRAGSAGTEGLGHAEGTEGTWGWACLSQPPVPPTRPCVPRGHHMPKPHSTCPVHVPSMCPIHVSHPCPTRMSPL